ncbi:hypothetical protein G3I40_06295, partial [Streptomyces sp. SID14478]|uniref:hypothetical protein n=1 Tax=Streptomyces sp. SID14478 TaxID=2706073 RepID=UPI0013DD663E
MDAALTTAVLLLLITVAAHVIHRLDVQHTERIALHPNSSDLPGRRAPAEPDAAAAPHPAPPTPADRHDHRGSDLPGRRTPA